MIRTVAAGIGVAVGVIFVLGLLLKLLMFLGLVILIGAGLSLSVNLIVIAREHLQARRVREKAEFDRDVGKLWNHILDVTSNESRETAEIRDAAYRDLHDADWLEAHGMPWTAGVILLDGWRATQPMKPPAHLVVAGNRVTCSEHSISGGGIKTPPYRIDVPSVGCKTCEDAAELNMNAYQLSTIIGRAQGASLDDIPIRTD
jgi:hypothetical protein